MKPGQAVAVDARGGMQPQARTQFRDAMAQLPPIMIMDPSSGNARAKLAADYWWEHPDTLSYHATGYDPLAGVDLYDDKGRKIRNVYEPGHTAPAAPVGPDAVDPSCTSSGQTSRTLPTSTRCCKFWRIWCSGPASCCAGLR